MGLEINDLFSVRGKVALVTGGSSGIGRMIAEGLCRNGAKVYVASRKLDACQAVAAELSQLGECIPLAVDLADQTSLQALAAEIAAREPKLHILVNNAGAGWAQRLDDYPEAGWDKVMALNVKAPFFLTKALLPQLRAAAEAADPARVVNIGSISGIQGPRTNNYAYGTSKAAVHHLTRNLAHTLAHEHITVNAIAPGPFPSRMMGAQLDAMVEHVPLARGGSPEDAAGTTIFLCSRAGAYITGVVLPVDGGASA
jgi:NAD(P)-dependent dehydrogenase (short-subunit alcohol dehydrogenase family)